MVGRWLGGTTSLLSVRFPGQPPPPGSIVVREGKVKDVTNVLEEAADDRVEREDDGSWNGFYHLSVFAAPLESEEELDEAVGRLFGQHRTVKWYRVAQLEALTQLDFELIASAPEPYHYDVVLGEVLSVPIVQAFESCFGEERRNGLWRQRS